MSSICLMDFVNSYLRICVTEFSRSFKDFEHIFLESVHSSVTTLNKGRKQHVKDNLFVNYLFDNRHTKFNKIKYSGLLYELKVENHKKVIIEDMNHSIIFILSYLKPYFRKEKKKLMREAKVLS